MESNIINTKPKLKMTWSGRYLSLEQWFIKHKVSSNMCYPDEAIMRAKKYLNKP